MGYITDSKGKLCCDICGKPKARKHKCPYGWCQPYAICPECWSKPEIKKGMTKEAHSKCKESSDWMAEKDKKQDELMNEGKYIRSSAIDLGHEVKPYNVKVTFKNKEGLKKEFLMSEETYKAYDLLTPTTPDDYIRHGLLVPLKNL
jgi:hypothetical protein